MSEAVVATNTPKRRLRKLTNARLERFICGVPLLDLAVHSEISARRMSAYELGTGTLTAEEIERRRATLDRLGKGKN
jgi:hypothetical protein